jgi:hypothetical protein
MWFSLIERSVIAPEGFTPAGALALNRLAKSVVILPALSSCVGNRANACHRLRTDDFTVTAHKD